MNEAKSRNTGRKISSFMHLSLDGFVAAPNGEMSWFKVDEEVFDHVGKRISGVSIVPRWRGKYFDINVFTN